MRHKIQTKFSNWWNSVWWCPEYKWGIDPSYKAAVERGQGPFGPAPLAMGSLVWVSSDTCADQSEVYAKAATDTYSSAVCMWPRRWLPHWHLSAKHPSWIRDPGANAADSWGTATASGIISQGIREESWQSIVSNRLSFRQCLSYLSEHISPCSSALFK